MIKLVIAFTLLATSLAALAPLRPIPSGSQPGKVIAILRSDSNIAPDGSSYEYAYETENGISAQESGSLVGSGPDAALAATGSFQYTSPEGVPVQISYVANLDGFQATGDAIPTPPPIPDAIVRALAYNEAHPEAETSKPSISKGFLLTSF